MSNLHIVEFQGVPAGDNAIDLEAATAAGITSTQIVSITSGSVQSGLFQPTTRWVRLLAGAACSLSFGANPTAAAGGYLMTSGTPPEFIRVPDHQNWRIAVIQDTP